MNLRICLFNHGASDVKRMSQPVCAGLRLLEVVLPLPLRPLRFRLQGYPGNVLRVREGDPTGRMEASSAFLSFTF